MKLHSFFSHYPVFTYGDFVKFLTNHGEANPNTSKALLAYHLHNGHVKRIKRGLFAVIPNTMPPYNVSFLPSSERGDFIVDPYLITAKLTEDAVIAYHSALAFYGKTYSVHSLFTYLTHSLIRKLNFQSCEYQAVLFPKKLIKHQQENFEINTVDRQGTTVRVTSFERTLVDMLDRPDLCGGWEEVWRSLELVEYFNIKKIVEYALLLDNATTVAKVGFYLEQHQKELHVENYYLEQLQAHRPKQPQYIDRESKLPSQFSSKWNLIIPSQIIEKSWEEPS